MRGSQIGQVAVHPDDLDLYLRKWRASIVSGDPVEFEARVRRSDGEYRWFLARAVAQRDDRGNILKWYEVLTDIEDRKRAEAEARENERRYREGAEMQLAHANRVAAMGQLTASIAHEVNQPIAATVTNAQAALRWLGAEPPNLDELQQTLGRIVRDGNRAGAVVGRIRLIKKEPPGDERVDINAAIREVIELTRNEAMKNGVLVQSDLVWPGARSRRSGRTATGDPQPDPQRPRGHERNEVKGGAETPDRRREDRVGRRGARHGAQSGPGLTPATLEHLFEAFHTTKPNGLGLGLSISRSIIESHGGTLSASANSPRGAVFHFTLPTRPDIASLQ